MALIKLLFLVWQNCRVCINANNIKKSNLFSDLEAAQKAEQLSQSILENGENFTFETVLSTIATSNY